MAQDQGRGTTILVLGILGLVCCAFLGPVAWIMGKGDMAKIKTGEIAKEAEQLTNVGMILGIIGTVLLGIQIVGGCIWGILVGVAASKGGGMQQFKAALDVFDAVTSVM